jgi:release factor-specific protein-(glutamine-N5) methyltransferase
MKNIQIVLNELTQRLSALYSTSEARHVAWWLLEAVTDCSRTQLMAQQNEQNLTEHQQAILELWLHEHMQLHKPLQYLIGWVPFCDLRIVVRPPTLIPRSETEEWCERLITLLQNAQLDSPRILDLCTGSGCIGLALAHAFPKSTIVAVDIDESALDVARENTQLNGITNIEFVQSDLFAAVNKESFDLIVANPPYIGMQEYSSLAASVQQWEDKKALIGGTEGTELIARIIADAPRYLKKQNVLSLQGLPNVFIEIGYQQAAAVQTLMCAENYHAIQVWQDLAGNDRVVCGVSP